ncbi:PIN domain-containing protein [Bacillus sp. 1P02SD]|uniref:PIN domain-containing protein n=1 Tax=Bacillus sp. 1P02SD TaxID=3132264 RepID=UPI0039A08B79
MTNVFIDTQVFVQKNFNLQNDLFKRLVNASEDGLISIYLTDIVINEVESKIYEQVYEKIKNSHTKFSKDAKILKNLSEYSNTFDIGEKLDQIFNDLIKQFKQFLVDASVEVISVDDVSPAFIFKMYFKGSPPFSKKKRDEFPDAFSLVALENWFEQQNEEVFIVSDDGDLKNYCEESYTLVYEPSLESLFDSLIKIHNYKHKFIISVYDTNYDKIESFVKDQFEEHGFILIGEDGDIEKVDVQSIELDEDPYIIEVDEEEEETATIAFNASVSFFANISYVDYSNSYYDKEEGKYLYQEIVNTELDDDVTVSILMKFKYKYNDKEEIEVNSLSLNEGESIEIVLPNDY